MERVRYKTNKGKYFVIDVTDGYYETAEILANSDRQKSFKKDFKKPSDRQSAPRRKPRVFGPDGVKDI